MTSLKGPSPVEGPVRRQIELDARRENLQQLRDFVESVCAPAGVSDRIIGQLKLAVDEVCTNIVLYGYRGMGPGKIRVAVELGEDQVAIEIADFGSPFHPDQAPAPDLTSDWQKRRVGGLGWHLVRQVVDRIDYRAGTDDGNILRLEKGLGPGPADEGTT